MLEMKTYEDFLKLSQNIGSTDFIENLNAVLFICTNPRLSMRIHQDKYSNILRKKIQDMSITGENTIYTIICSCIGIVFLSIGLTFPVFIWVIKDKSYVISIFADITDEEINEIIESAMNFDIRCVHYKKKWILTCANEEDRFWKICLQKNKEHHEENDSPQNKLKNIEKNDLLENNKNTNKDTSKIDDTFKPINSTQLKPTQQNSTDKNTTKYPILEFMEAKENENLQIDESEKIPVEKSPEKSQFCRNNGEDESPDATKHKLFQNEIIIKAPDTILEEEKKRKASAKRLILGRLDTKLRNTAIFRLVVILTVFLVYGAVSLYFNYFVHDYSRSSMTHFYNLLKRSLYIPTITTMIRMAITEKNSKYLSPNLSILAINIDEI